MLPLTASLQGHATKGAAEGLLGKVYLTMGNYSEAKIELLKVVNSGQYALLDDPNDIFDTEMKVTARLSLMCSISLGSMETQKEAMLL